MFEEWGLLGNALILLASLAILDKASDWTITNAVKVADITGFGKTTIGFILVAFSTSLPELCVSIFATLDEELIGVAIGNVLGSNIVNICLILGVCFLLITLKSSEIVKIIPVMLEEDVGTLYFGLFISSIVPLSLIYIGYASRLIGIILLAIFTLYVYKLSKVKIIKEDGSLGEEKRKLPRYILSTVLGAVIVVASSHLIVNTASHIAEALGIPKIVIGATIIAFGTSLPELVTSIDSTQRGHIDLALGNIVGSCFTNTTCILGVTLLGSNLRVNMAAFSNLVTFSLMTNLLLWYFLSGEKISWREGAILLFMYTIFILTSYGGYRA
ncbi:sodium:calcium antiporter [Candidatus Bathyarchaeota archaeon]|nr:sodium:calcium antiporter [Candidatus Bathyarchaeota archaeon]MBS7613882.1 sodium:calcium antiporter [Candidatus Bathyarchaeota archaeon]MBS7617379.1 sodium:calcium antiporter [Candidatus Bathyarchaeota archaeon]